VHDNDMTSSLESFHGSPIAVEVLGRKLSQRHYFREVVLLSESTAKPVEFGAIKIYLQHFPLEARRHILEERWPLGRILKYNCLPFSSRPKAFLRLASDPFISQVLRLSGTRILYGRCNSLFHDSGDLLAEIVEVLPPVDESERPPM